MKKRIDTLETKYLKRKLKLPNYDELCDYLSGWVAFSKQCNSFNLKKRVSLLVESKFKGNISLQQIDRQIRFSEVKICR